MKIWLRRGLTLASAFLLLLVGGLGALWWAGARQLAQDHGALPEALAGGPGDPALGARLVEVYGCTSCHGSALTGEDFYGLPAPNLTAKARQYSAEDFARVVRRGLRPDGTSVVWAMPSEFFASMADNELAAIYAHLRRLGPRPDAVSPGLFTRPMTAVLMAMGVSRPSAEVVRASDRGPAQAPSAGSPQWGPYFTAVACAECHNHGLGGYPGDTPPLAAAIERYDWPAFRRFTTTGVTPEGGKLPMMSRVSRVRLSHLTEGERLALFNHLKSLAQPR